MGQTSTDRPVTWAPTEAQKAAARLTDFAAWVLEHRGLELNGYRQIHRWSVHQPSDFWDCLREYFDVLGEGFDGPALAEERMPGAVWYPRARLNYAENVLRHARNPETRHATALLTVEEDDSTTVRTWAQLEAEVEAGLPSLEHTLLVRNLAGTPGTGTMAAGSAGGGTTRGDFAAAAGNAVQPEYARVPFAHPLWVLFSSGTTGAPKGIVHGHGGMLLEGLKDAALAHDMGPGDLYYVAANTSWMVWNTLVSYLAAGSAVVTYAGSPMYGRKDRQFQILANNGATMFATGAAYLQVVETSGLEPGADWDLSRLRNIMSTGSPLPDSTWAWVHEHVKADVHLGSESGGTDICSGFIGSNPLEPVHLGELQGPLLGVAVEAWDESGRRVVDAVGDMVITRPMPSMPVFFWGDEDGAKYRGSYFEKFPGVWTHGDWITETAEGAFVVHGRSDATLNRAGVRLGSADIYGALRHVPEVRESLVIGVERPGGGYFMPLFVVLDDGAELTDALRERIAATIRERTSARHVPDAIIQAPAVPVTHAQKKIEVPVKKLFAGHDPEKAVNRGSLANPEVIDWYVEQAREFLEGGPQSPPR